MSRPILWRPTSMPDFDLTPAARALADLVAGVPDAALAGPTPCPDMAVGDLLDHIGGLSIAFTVAATKERLPGGPMAPAADAANLPADWRTEIPARLAGLAAAWKAPAAWEGTTMAGPVEMPAPIAARVALDEVVVHGWDLARSTGQPFAADPALLSEVQTFVGQFSGPGQDEARQGLFGPEVPVPDDAPLLDRVLGQTGRHPGWTPA